MMSKVKNNNYNQKKKINAKLFLTTFANCHVYFWVLLYMEYLHTVVLLLLEQTSAMHIVASLVVYSNSFE